MTERTREIPEALQVANSLSISSRQISNSTRELYLEKTFANRIYATLTLPDIEPRNLKLPKPVWREVAVTNVYMSNNEFSIPGVISDPVNAHTGYFVNPTVMEMLICGMDNAVPRPCPPEVSP